MGFENRDYYRDDDQPSRKSLFDGVSVYRRLIAFTVIAYLLQNFLKLAFRPSGLEGPSGAESLFYHSFFTSGPFPDSWFGLTTSAVLHGAVWQLVTYAFLHGDPMHLVWNMLLVWFVGPIIEHSYGWKTFLWIYFVGAIFGGVATILIDLSTPDAFLPVVGASAAALSLMMVWTMQAPRQSVMFCGIVPLEARWLMAIIVFVDFIPVFNALNGSPERSSGIAHAAHLGGVLWGYLFYKTRFNPFQSWSFPSWKSVKHKVGLGPRLRVVRNEADEDQSLREEVDTILEKIQREGEASLTKRERNVLIEASKRFKNRT